MYLETIATEMFATAYILGDSKWLRLIMNDRLRCFVTTFTDSSLFKLGV